MKIGLACSVSSRNLVGRVEPEGSTRVVTPSAASAFLAQGYEKTVATPVTAETVLGRLRADPTKAFAALEDGFRVKTAARCHIHAHCNSCHGTGRHRCGACHGSGKTSCTSCGGGGHGNCSACQGRGQRQVSAQVWNSTLNCQMVETRTVSCSSCSGCGRAGNCGHCYGNGKVDCIHCGADGSHSCRTCAETGWLTVASEASIVGKPSRFIAHFSENPPAFREAVSALPVTHLPVKHGRVTVQGAELKDGLATVTLDVTVPHVTLHARFADDTDETFEAVGPDGVIPIMPVFLDRLLAEHLAGAREASARRDHRTIYELTEKSRVAKSALLAATRKGKPDADEFRKQWKGALSGAACADLLNAMRGLVDGVGARSVRKLWTLTAIPVVAIAGVAFPLHFGGTAMRVIEGIRNPDLMPFQVLGCTCALGLAPLAAVRWLSVRRARRAVRTFALIPSDIRTPSQGWRAGATTMAAIAALAAGAILSNGLPTPAPTFRQAAATQLLPERRPADMSVSVRPPVRVHVLSPSSRARLAPVLDVGRTRGDADLYRAQVYLAQLGFLREPPSGRPTPSSADAVSRFAEALPPDRPRPTAAADVARDTRAVLAGEIALVGMPADGLGLSGLSPVLKANLRPEDVAAFRRAAAEAVANPGHETAWAVSAHAGRMIASDTGTGCPLLQAEFKIRGQVETKGPLPVCDTHILQGEQR